VFDGGRLDSQRKAAIAAYERAAAQYRGVVLSAFQDVANALRALQADADTLGPRLRPSRRRRQASGSPSSSISSAP